LIYTPHTKKALQICFKAHKKQTDKSGLPYVFHPFHLAEQMEDEESTVVALLHDVLEDSKFTMDDLKKQGFSPTVLEALAYMTHNKTMPYMQYVLKIKENDIARKVKIEDLKHNSDLSRLESVSKKDLQRVLKYQIALALLQDGKYDSHSDSYCKNIPLDNDKLCFFSVRYRGEEVISASFDVEAENDEHYDLTASQYLRLMRIMESDTKSAYENIADVIQKQGYSLFGIQLVNDYCAKHFSY